MEISVATHPPEFHDLWLRDLCGSWDHLCATAAAGGWGGGAVHDYGVRYSSVYCIDLICIPLLTYLLYGHFL